MLPVPVLLGDGVHALSVIMFLAIVGIKGNGSGISLKSHVLYLLVFLTRYLDLFISFYSWYNTLMKAFYIGSTLTIITIMMKVEPAKSTYSATQDSVQYWNLVIGVGIFSMLVHLIGGGVLNIKGSSGQEFEVHFENYSWLLFLWTFSVCLEPLAMIPQLYIFFKNRLLKRDVRIAMLLMGSYRMFYIFFWISRALKSQAMEHHYLLYFTGVLQVLTYADFFIYHWSVFMLLCLSNYSRVVGDSSSMVTDSGIETWALTATGRHPEDYYADKKEDLDPKDEAWRPGDQPASHTLEMKQMGGIGVV